MLAQPSLLDNLQMGSEINGAKGKRKQGVDNFGFRGRGETTMDARLQKRKNQLNDIQNGSPLVRRQANWPNSVGPTAPILDRLLKTHYTEADYDDGIGLNEMETNTKYVVNRLARRIAPTYQAISVNQLAFLFMKGQENLNTARLRSTDVMVQVNPLPIFTPETLNFLFRRIQLEMSEKDPEKYRLLTPSDIWRDYCIDGVPESELPITDGGINNGNKYITMARKGMTYMENYWGSNIRTDAKLYMVIKKFRHIESEFNVGTLKAMNGASGYKYVDGGNSKFNPYQVGFFCLPYGGPIPVHEKRYIDDFDQERYDGLVMSIGTVLSAPREHVFKEVREPTRAFTGISRGMIDGVPRGDGQSHLFDQNPNTSLMRVHLKFNNGVRPI